MTDIPKIRVPLFKAAINARDFIRVMLRDLGQYVAPSDIAVTYDGPCNTYRVTIARWSKNGAGCGTFEWRERKWNELQQTVRAKFDLRGSIYTSCQWIHNNSYEYDFHKDGTACIPCLTAFIAACEFPGSDNTSIDVAPTNLRY